MSEPSNCDPSSVPTMADLLAASGLRAAEGADADPLTGWPKRVVHEKTGAVLVLIPAGEFVVGTWPPDFKKCPSCGAFYRFEGAICFKCVKSTESGREEPGKGGPGVPSEAIDRRVIRRPFYLGETTVTEKQWAKVMGGKSSDGRYDNFPKADLSWKTCQEFLRKAGGGLRLPSESEWEYACRAGTTTPFFFGWELTNDQANFLKPPHNGESAAECRSYPANAWGLYEMHGNVWEWCQDMASDGPGHGDERPWEEGNSIHTRKLPNGVVLRVVRGGSFLTDDDFCGSSSKHFLAAYEHNDDIGLRLARSVPGMGDDVDSLSSEGVEVEKDGPDIESELQALENALKIMIDKFRKSGE